jgi:uncharacterized protein (TIGR02594 family)
MIRRIEAIMLVLAALMLALVVNLLAIGISHADGRPSHCPPRRWCGCWLASQFGLSHDRSLWRARQWVNIGRPARHGCIGCVAVLKRGRTGGHVGIVQSYDGDDPVLLSGNHNNAVGVGTYRRAQVIAYRWVR